MDKVLFTSNKSDWETPPELFNLLDQDYHFTLDVCATEQNAKCKEYITPEQDAFVQPWTGVCWMNPPYGRNIGLWVKRAYEASLEGATVVCLLPARTDTAWWHDYVLPYAEITFIRGRLKFVGAENNAPFPSVIAAFTPSKE